MKLLIFILGIPSVLLALAVLEDDKVSRQNYWAALLLSAFGVVLPLFVFVAGAAMTPISKADSPDGWIDCFHAGKLALSPLVLWASAAFFAADVYKVKVRTETWIVLGYFVGAVVSIVCTVFGLVCVREAGVQPFLLVPIYVAIWYSIRAISLVKASRLRTGAYSKTILGSLPFWIGSVLWSRNIYKSLPDRANDCFLVTAATRGHQQLVGPFFEVARRNQKQIANRQLATLWQFEDLWRDKSPRSHGAFRRVYNQVGPHVARRISQPWMADIVYLAIKPVELLATLMLALATKGNFMTGQQNYKHKQGGIV